MERFTDRLREAAQPAWSEAVSHRFVRELSADTLADDVYRAYLRQDYAFIGNLISLVAHAVAYAPNMQAMKRLSGFLGVLTGDENTYFQRSFDALGVEAVSPEEIPHAATTSAFADLIREAGDTRAYGPVMVVLLAAEWTYLTWAREAAAAPRPNRFYLAEWIDLHAIGSFAEFVAWIRVEVDRLGDTYPDDCARLTDFFCRTMALEAAFFDQAYALAGGDPIA